MKIAKIIKLNRRINTLENDVETLQNIIKEELYKEFINNINDTSEIKRLKEENKKLKLKVKDLKEIIKGGE